MESIVMYLFLMILQVQGGAVAAYPELQQCIVARAEAIKQPDVVLVSECMEVTLVRPPAPKPI